MAPRYRVDGLVIDAPVQVLGLPGSVAPTDWRIEVVTGALPSEDPDLEWTGEAKDAERTWCRFARRPGLVRIDLLDICTIEAATPWRRARLLIPEGGASPVSAMRHAFPYLAALRGQLALHAASVVLGDGAIALCGEATTGKSTLAVALDARGVPVLGDDHVVLQAAKPWILAHPSWPFADVAQASRAVFRADGAAAPGKARIPLLTPRPDHAVRLRGIAFLRRADGVRATRVPPAQVLIRLLRDVLFVGDPASRWEYEERFVAATRVAEEIPAWDVEIPTGLDALASNLSAIQALLGGFGAR